MPSSRIEVRDLSAKFSTRGIEIRFNVRTFKTDVIGHRDQKAVGQKHIWDGAINQVSCVVDGEMLANAYCVSHSAVKWAEGIVEQGVSKS